MEEWRELNDFVWFRRHVSLGDTHAHERERVGRERERNHSQMLGSFHSVCGWGHLALLVVVIAASSTCLSPCYAFLAFGIAYGFFSQISANSTTVKHKTVLSFAMRFDSFFSLSFPFLPFLCDVK